MGQNSEVTETLEPVCSPVCVWWGCSQVCVLDASMDHWTPSTSSYVTRHTCGRRRSPFEFTSAASGSGNRVRGRPAYLSYDFFGRISQSAVEPINPIGHRYGANETREMLLVYKKLSERLREGLSSRCLGAITRGFDWLGSAIQLLHQYIPGLGKGPGPPR